LRRSSEVSAGGGVVPIALAWAALAPGVLGATPAAEALQSRYEQLQPQLTNNRFGAPVHLESREEEADAEGDVFAVLNHGFPAVARALTDAGNWCDILVLHVNIKFCRPVGTPARLAVNVGRRFEQPLEDTHQIDFAFDVEANEPKYLSVALLAARGPFGTRDYRVGVAAIPIRQQQTFLKLRYSYAYGATARLAMSAYLATAGRELVGFTSTGGDGGSGTEYVRGLRGVLERNAMRYYLAIDASIATMDAPAATRLEARLDHWADAAERYPRQLLDFERESYVAMKKNEYARQRAAPTGASP
jgi:hypothetical protein